MRRLNWFAALSSLDYPPGQCDETAVSSPYSKIIRAISTSERRPSNSGRSFAAPICPCACRAALRCRKLKPTSQRVQLQRRNTEIGNNTAYLPDFRCREDPRKFTKNQHAQSGSASRIALIALLPTRERFFIAIDSQHLRVGRCLVKLPSLCPPRPTVQSTNNPPRLSCEQLDRLSKVARGR